MNQKSLLPGDFLNSLMIFQHSNNLSKLLVFNYLILIVMLSLAFCKGSLLHLYVGSDRTDAIHLLVLFVNTKTIKFLPSRTFTALNVYNQLLTF